MPLKLSKTDQLDQLFELYRQEVQIHTNRRILIELDCDFSEIEDYVKDFKMKDYENVYYVASNIIHFYKGIKMSIRDITTPDSDILITL